MPTCLIWFYYSALGPKHRATIPVGWRALSHRAHSRNPHPHQVLHTLVWEPVKTLDCKRTSGSFAVIDSWSERKPSPSRNILQTVTQQRLMPTVQRWSSSDEGNNLKQHHQEKVSLGAKSPPTNKNTFWQSSRRKTQTNLLGSYGHNRVSVIHCF